MCVLRCASLVLIGSNQIMCSICVFSQALFVGGIFTQFSRDSDGNYAIDQGGLRSLSVAQIAIDRVNNKSDGVYDNLLPNTQVRYMYAIYTLICDNICYNVDCAINPTLSL